MPAEDVWYVQTIPVNEPYERLSLERYLIEHLNPSDNTRGRVVAAAVTDSRAMEAKASTARRAVPA